MTPLPFRPLSAPSSRLVRNAARCRACGDVIESQAKNDFRACACGKIAIDGGLAEQRAFGEAHYFEDLSERETRDGAF